MHVFYTPDIQKNYELPEEEAYEEEMTQAEKLQIEMMRMGGNKLNFQV